MNNGKSNFWSEFGSRMKEPGNFDFNFSLERFDFAREYSKDFNRLVEFDSEKHLKKNFTGFVYYPSGIAIVEKIKNVGANAAFILEGEVRYLSGIKSGVNGGDYDVFYKNGFSICRNFLLNDSFMVHEKYFDFHSPTDVLSMDFFQDDKNYVFLNFYTRLQSKNHLELEFDMNIKSHVRSLNKILVAGECEDFSEFISGIKNVSQSRKRNLCQSLEGKFTHLFQGNIYHGEQQ